MYGEVLPYLLQSAAYQALTTLTPERELAGQTHCVVENVTIAFAQNVIGRYHEEMNKPSLFWVGHFLVSDILERSLLMITCSIL